MPLSGSFDIAETSSDTPTSTDASSYHSSCTGIFSVWDRHCMGIFSMWYGLDLPNQPFGGEDIIYEDQNEVNGDDDRPILGHLQPRCSLFSLQQQTCARAPQRRRIPQHAQGAEQSRVGKWCQRPPSPSAVTAPNHTGFLLRQNSQHFQFRHVAPALIPQVFSIVLTAASIIVATKKWRKTQGAQREQQQ